MGFQLNPYDQCVANKEIKGKQCTVGFHVDDNMAAHADEEVLTAVIEILEEKVGKMTVTRGNEHIFLGMKVKFNNDGTLNVNMSDYVQEAIEAFPEKLRRKATTPATTGLFTFF